MAEGERGGVVPWDGRPPKEHEAAPAHLLRDDVDNERVSEWHPALGWFLIEEDGAGYCESSTIAGLGWSYVTPLYPPAAAQDAEGVLREVGARPLDDWDEDMGAVLWWLFPVEEAPWVGAPGDSDWPGYHTHFTPLPAAPAIPAAPAALTGAGGTERFTAPVEGDVLQASVRRLSAEDQS